MTTRSLIVIPAYNEVASVADVVKSCAKYCDVLVVDDGSIDNTCKASTEAGAKVITNKTNRGYEYSLNIGYKYAVKFNYDLMITMDADGQLPPNNIPEFIEAIDAGACLVVGRRRKSVRLCEKILSYSSSRLSSILDPYCGMKAYNLKALRRKSFSKYNSIGTSLAFEYVEQKLKCKNIDIEINDREGKSKFGGKLSSELKLFHSMFIGIYRLVKHWLIGSRANNANV